MSRPSQTPEARAAYMREYRARRTAAGRPTESTRASDPPRPVLAYSKRAKAILSARQKLTEMQAQISPQTAPVE